MCKSHICLPPGIYYITATNQRGYVVPKKSGTVLQFDDGTAKKAWKFTGDGKFICMDDSSYAYCSSLDHDSQVLGDNKNTMSWSVSVVDHGNNTYKGTVMTSDDQESYWAVYNSTVVLKGESWEFVFTPR